MRRHSAAQARSLQQLQASARAALSSAGMVDWPLPIRALSLLFCVGAILADLVIVGFTGTWLVDAAVYRYNHAIGAAGLSYNMTFSVLNTSIEWDLALPPIRNGTSSLAGSIDGLEEGGGADLGSFVLHAYALVLRLPLAHHLVLEAIMLLARKQTHAHALLSALAQLGTSTPAGELSVSSLQVCDGDAEAPGASTAWAGVDGAALEPAAPRRARGSAG